MPDTLVLLRLEHRNFVRVLDVLDAMTDRLERGDTIDGRLLDQVFRYFLGYPECCHHPKEDLVYERLRRRDPTTAARVGDLLADHQALGEQTHAAAARARKATGGVDPGLVEVLRRFSEATRRHLRTEEEEIFPAMVRTLTREDWDEIDFTLFDQKDPVFDLRAETEFRALRRAIVDRATAAPPPDEAEGEA